MAMVVQHNLTAMNANRQLGVTTGGQAKSSEKLSSGYRINRAGDDAAGLKISEKMRSQVRGLNKASSNAQDGVSLIQTAEGALNEAHSILQRMNELAVQGANDTNESIDRDAINQELDALTAELDRIASTTQFNKQNLLDGTFQDKNLQVGANTNQRISITITSMNAAAIGLTSFNYQASAGKAGVSGKLGGSYLKGYDVNGTTYQTGTSAQLAAVNAAKTNTKLISAKVQFTISTNDSNVFKVVSAGNSFKYTTFSAAAATATKLVSTEAKKEYSTTGSLNAHKMLSQWDAVASVAAVPATSKKATGANVATYEAANKTISMVQAAINKVSEQRSALGALQNRLEHTIANLDNVAENTQAAESRIRDTDMASEMVEYSKNNILAQAGQSMLAQSNQSTQGVLSLLQ